jgi:hypothetical protein
MNWFDFQISSNDVETLTFFPNPSSKNHS